MTEQNYYDGVNKRRAREESQTHFDLDAHPGRTKQSEKESTDMKRIVERYQRTGEIAPHLRNPAKPLYEDFTSVGDYMDCFQRVFDAREAFEELPARLRDHFDNDPLHLVEAFFDPERQEELKELLIVNPEPARDAPDGVDTTTGEVVEPPAVPPATTDQ